MSSVTVTVSQDVIRDGKVQVLVEDGSSIVTARTGHSSAAIPVEDLVDGWLLPYDENRRPRDDGISVVLGDAPNFDSISAQHYAIPHGWGIQRDPRTGTLYLASAIGNQWMACPARPSVDPNVHYLVPAFPLVHEVEGYKWKARP